MPLQKHNSAESQDMSAGEQAYSDIIDLILTRELRPGERTSVNLLADRLGLGRTPIKDAITRLQTEGVLTVVGRSGTTVKTINADEARQLFALRRVFEDYAAPEIVRNISAAEIKHLRDLLDILRGSSVTNADAIAASASFVRANVAFHSTIIGAAKNPLLDRFYSQIQIHAQIVTYLVFRGHDTQAAQKRQAEHDGIVAALRARDAAALKKRLREHSEASERLILRFLEEKQDSNSKSKPRRSYQNASI